MNSPQAWPAPAVGETELSNPTEAYHRQCHPRFMLNGWPTTQMYEGISSDPHRVSGARGSVTTPTGAYTYYTQTLGNKSAGTWTVTVADVAKAGSRLIDDTKSATAPNPCPPGHTFLDLRPPLSKTERKRVRNVLHILARQTYPAPQGSLDI